MNEPDHIDVIDLAIEATGHRGFELTMPSPNEFYTFAHFNSPICLLDCSGTHERPAGVTIIYAPDDSRHIHAVSAEFMDTWFNFTGPGVAPCLSAYAIPTNRALELGELPFLRSIMVEIRKERSDQLIYWQDAVSDLVRRLFRELNSLQCEIDGALLSRKQPIDRILREIRARVRSDLVRRWTVHEMAQLGNLDPSSFAPMFTKQFGISPVNDLLDARLKHAEKLLIHSPMPIAQVAHECGFANVEHFNRLFRKRMGCKPSQTRHQHKQ